MVGIEGHIAPEDRVLAGLQPQRARADVEVAEHERIEELARRTAIEALRERGVAVVVVAAACLEAGSCLDAVVVVALVVPRRRADAKAHAALVDEIELRQQVDAVVDDVAAVELVVGLVAVGRIGDLRVLAVCAYAHVVAHGVVPARGEVRVAGPDFDGVRAVGRAQRGQRAGQQARGGEA